MYIAIEIYNALLVEQLHAKIKNNRGLMIIRYFDQFKIIFSRENLLYRNLFKLKCDSDVDSKQKQIFIIGTYMIYNISFNTGSFQNGFGMYV